MPENNSFSKFSRASEHLSFITDGGCEIIYQVPYYDLSYGKSRPRLNSSAQNNYRVMKNACIEGVSPFTHAIPSTRTMYLTTRVGLALSESSNEVD